MSSTFSKELTISIIVKNEAQTLKDCLEALTPLRKALPCQLILTDTGSTDGTQDIARAYADLYLEFDWCNDFSKARNHAIPHATGRWFFYLDADEICDDTVLEIASFLASPESEKSTAASVALRNYRGDTQDLSRYDDCFLPRLVNFQQGKRFFEYAIHESIPVTGTLTPLSVILHHSGYLYSRQQGKEGRNFTLLQQEIEKNPLELKHYVPLIREIKDQTQEKQWLDRAFSVVEQHPTLKQHFAFPSLLMELARHGLTYGKLDLLDQAMTRVRTSCEASYHYLEILGMKLEFLCNKSYPPAQLLPLFLEYRTLHCKLLAQPDPLQLISSGFLLNTPFAYHHFELRMVHALLGSTVLEGGGTLLKHSTAYELRDENGNYPYLKKYTLLCCELGLFQRVDEVIFFYQEQKQSQAVTYCTALKQQFLREKGGNTL